MNNTKKDIRKALLLDFVFAHVNSNIKNRKNPGYYFEVELYPEFQTKNAHVDNIKEYILALQRIVGGVRIKKPDIIENIISLNNKETLNALKVESHSIIDDVIDCDYMNKNLLEEYIMLEKTWYKEDYRFVKSNFQLGIEEDIENGEYTLKDLIRMNNF